MRSGAALAAALALAPGLALALWCVPVPAQAQEAPGEPAAAAPGTPAPPDARRLVDRPATDFLTAGAGAVEAQPLPDRAAIHAALASGRDYLLTSQNPDGSWGSWGEPADEFWSNPHSHFAWIAATTGLVVMTLIEEPESEATTAAVDRALDFLTNQAALQRPSDWDVDNTWGLIYGLETLSMALQHPRYADSQRAPAMRRKAEEYLEGLAQTQSPDGGWGYYDMETLAQRPSWSTSFMTAVAILALHSAEAAGLPVPAERFARAVTALERCRLPTGAYTYSVEAIPSPGGATYIDQIKGSLGRTQVGNLALVLAGSDKVTHEDLLAGLDAFFEHHRFLDVARKRPYPHEAYYYNSGYFYFFGHYYAARVIELLPAAEQVRYQSRLAREVVKTQEDDGSMWDFYFNTYHKPYGTAFGTLALRRTLPREEPPPAPARGRRSR